MLGIRHPFLYPHIRKAITNTEKLPDHTGFRLNVHRELEGSGQNFDSVTRALIQSPKLRFSRSRFDSVCSHWTAKHSM